MPQAVRALTVREESRIRDSADKNPHDRKTSETFPVFPQHAGAPVTMSRGGRTKVRPPRPQFQLEDVLRRRGRAAAIPEDGNRVVVTVGHGHIGPAVAVEVPDRKRLGEIPDLVGFG